MACPLCDAANQDYRLILKDDFAFAIVNLEPLNKFHLMVLPLRHVESLDDITGQEAKSIFGLLHKLEHAIISLSGNSPVVWVHRGAHPSQPHIHFHILPSGHNFRHILSSFEHVPFRDAKTQAELFEIKDNIIKNLR